MSQKEIIKINDQTIAGIDQEIKALGDQQEKLIQQIRGIKSDNVRQIFNGVLPDEVAIMARGWSNDTFEFRMFSEEHNRDREIFSLFAGNRWGENDYKELSYYTTSCTTDFEFKRLELLGIAAKVINGFDTAELITLLAEGTKELLEEKEKLMDQIHAKQLVIQDLNKINQQLKRDYVKQAIFSEEGLSFKSPVSLTFAFKYDVYRITRVKFTDLSKSGKTGTLVYDVKQSHMWNEELNAYETQIIPGLKYTDMRVDKILRQINMLTSQLEEFAEEEVA